ncbi:MAG: ABC transporter permease subunit [Azospirillum sp.]|nr:ABC transporter permease subunit [Azospirillum sp.]
MSRDRPVIRGLVTVIVLLVAWQVVVLATGAAHFLLPPPAAVFATLIHQAPRLGHHALITLVEILLGLGFGVVLGAAAALVLAYWPPARRWLLPVLVVSQAVPVFALAPILVLWLGYGLASKVAMAVLIIFFPVTAAFFDGLRRTDPGWLDLARTMDAGPGRLLLLIRLPAALPAVASGIRIAAAVAPIGAVVGEWVGASSGLGYLMLYANARVQSELMFAALIVLGAMAVTLYFTIDRALRRALPWQPDSLPDFNQEK